MATLKVYFFAVKKWGKMAKPITKSLTFQGATISTVASLLITISPFFFSILRRHLPDVHHADLQDIEQIITTTLGLFAGGGATVAIAGRVRASEAVYTPHGLPGPDREDLLAKEVERELWNRSNS